MPLHGHHRQRHRQALVALLQLLKSLLDSHCAASVFESADSIQKAPVAPKRMAGGSGASTALSAVSWLSVTYFAAVLSASISTPSLRNDWTILVGIVTEERTA
jgi:hypothetical protein